MFSRPRSALLSANRVGAVRGPLFLCADIAARRVPRYGYGRLDATDTLRRSRNSRRRDENRFGRPGKMLLAKQWGERETFVRRYRSITDKRIVFVSIYSSDD